MDQGSAAPQPALEAMENHPPDIAALYAWLGAKGLKYRDFSVSRGAERSRLRTRDSDIADAVDSGAARSKETNRAASQLQDQPDENPVAKKSAEKIATGGFGLHIAGIAMVPVLLLLVVMAALPLAALPETIFAAMVFALAIWLNQISKTHQMTLSLICLSSFVTMRYAFWRSFSLATFLHDPTSHWSLLDAFFMLSLYGAELYAFVVMFLGYLQMLWPLQRMPAALPDEVQEWPHVDVLIPTYNEPLEVVRYTALAAVNMDWPPEKMHVYILDDSKREEFRRFAQEAGVGYITRSDNRHAKAGNINHALTLVSSPYVAIFDCDHAPTRSFLQTTMGWFRRDPKMGLVQTPHHFYSPDPFERNLQQFRTMPNEGELFYGIIQDCNDFWNATFFCGSCAVLRRKMLDQIGGIATETITEDAHTSLRMQIAGWNTSYLNVPQAAGLASERLSGHVKQRIRWARGMIQILRTDNPLMAPGLNWQQRLCYFNAMLYFLYALPRLIFLTGPLIYLLLGHVNIPGGWELILAYALPHLALTSLTNSRIQGQHRHSFWNEVYETVLAPYILLPTLLALVNPKFGKFQVTDKGGVVEESYFDARIAQPFLVLMVLNFLGLMMGPIDYYYRDPGHLGTVVMNSIWTIFNTIILGVSMAVAYESQQRRQNVRIEMQVPVRIRTPQGDMGMGMTEDLSGGGSAIHLGAPVDVLRGDFVSVILATPSGEAVLPARVLRARGRRIRIRFENLTIAEQEQLTMVLFSRADTWLEWGRNRTADRPLHSLGLITWISIQGIRHTFWDLISRRPRIPQAGDRSPASATVAGMLLLGVMAGMATRMVVSPRSTYAATLPSKPAATTQSKVATQSAALQTPSLQHGAPVPAQSSPANGNLQNQFHDQFTLRDIGITKTLVLRGIDSTSVIPFVLPQTEVADTAELHLRYRFSPGLVPSVSHVNVTINGSLFASVPMEPGKNDQQFEETLAVPVEMLVHKNMLSLEFIGQVAGSLNANGSDAQNNPALWLRIDPLTSLEISGDRLPLANDLKLLPTPFYDPDQAEPQTVSIVFVAAPSEEALQAAGVMASWLGVLADQHRVRLPVSIGGVENRAAGMASSLPSGNAIVIVERDSDDARKLFGLERIAGPTVAIRANPSDSQGKLLILAGQNASQTLQAAQALVLNPSVLSGSTVELRVHLPAARQPDDAPRWLPAGQITRFQDLTAEDLESDGSAPLNIPLRLPPDLYYGMKKNVRLYLDYRYNPMPLASDSSLNILENGSFIGSLPLPQGSKPIKELHAYIGLPVFKMHSFVNQISTVFYFQLHKTANGEMPINQRGAILPSSYIDLRGLYHWAVMPDLRLFSDAGFPFTRRADLSSTTVILPDAPSSAEIELYLTMMSRFSGSTGFPALRVQVRGPESLGKEADQDYLVLGTMSDQPALGQLASFLPIGVQRDGLHIRHADGFFAPLLHAWWRVQGQPQPESGDSFVTGALPDALLEGIESPWQSEQSVIVAVARDNAEIKDLLDASDATADAGDIQKSVSILRGNHFDSYRLGGQVYHQGQLPKWVLWSVWYAQYPYLALMLVLAICFLLAIVTMELLRQRAIRRVEAFAKQEVWTR